MTAQNLANLPKDRKDRRPSPKDGPFRVRTGLRAGCTNENISTWSIR